MSCCSLLVVRAFNLTSGCDMARLPDPGDTGYTSVVFVSNIGSAVYFLVDALTPFKPGDSIVFKSSDSYADYDGDYTLASVSYDGFTSTLTTTCIGTANVFAGT